MNPAGKTPNAVLTDEKQLASCPRRTSNLVAIYPEGDFVEGVPCVLISGA
jgi:hypothetical protein